MRPTPLEIIESVDMMRVIEHGYRVKMAMTTAESYAVDTIEDLNLVQEIMKNDPLTLKSQYMTKKVSLPRK